jgi:hypothetical protein
MIHFQQLHDICSVEFPQYFVFIVIKMLNTLLLSRMFYCLYCHLICASITFSAHTVSTERCAWRRCCSALRCRRPISPMRWRQRIPPLPHHHRHLCHHHYPRHPCHYHHRLKHHHHLQPLQSRSLMPPRANHPQPPRVPSFFRRCRPLRPASFRPPCSSRVRYDGQRSQTLAEHQKHPIIATKYRVFFQTNCRV